MKEKLTRKEIIKKYNFLKDKNKNLVYMIDINHKMNMLKGLHTNSLVKKVNLIKKYLDAYKFDIKNNFNTTKSKEIQNEISCDGEISINDIEKAIEYFEYLDKNNIKIKDISKNEIFDKVLLSNKYIRNLFKINKKLEILNDIDYNKVGGSNSKIEEEGISKIVDDQNIKAKYENLMQNLDVIMDDGNKKRTHIERKAALALNGLSDLAGSWNRKQDENKKFYEKALTELAAQKIAQKAKTGELEELKRQNLDLNNEIDMYGKKLNEIKDYAERSNKDLAYYDEQYMKLADAIQKLNQNERLMNSMDDNSYKTLQDAVKSLNDNRGDLEGLRSVNEDIDIFSKESLDRNDDNEDKEIQIPTKFNKDNHDTVDAVEILEPDKNLVSDTQSKLTGGGDSMTEKLKEYKIFDDNFFEDMNVTHDKINNNILEIKRKQNLEYLLNNSSSYENSLESVYDKQYIESILGNSVDIFGGAMSSSAPPPLSSAARGTTPPPLSSAARGTTPPPPLSSAADTKESSAPPPLSSAARGTTPAGAEAKESSAPPLSSTARGTTAPPLSSTARGTTTPPTLSSAAETKESSAPPPLSSSAIISAEEAAKQKAEEDKRQSERNKKIGDEIIKYFIGDIKFHLKGKDILFSEDIEFEKFIEIKFDQDQIVVYLNTNLLSSAIFNKNKSPSNNPMIAITERKKNEIIKKIDMIKDSAPKKEGNYIIDPNGNLQNIRNDSDSKKIEIKIENGEAYISNDSVDNFLKEMLQKTTDFDEDKINELIADIKLSLISGGAQDKKPLIKLSQIFEVIKDHLDIVETRAENQNDTIEKWENLYSIEQKSKFIGAIYQGLENCKKIGAKYIDSDKIEVTVNGDDIENIKTNYKKRDRRYNTYLKYRIDQLINIVNKIIIFGEYLDKYRQSQGKLTNMFKQYNITGIEIDNFKNDYISFAKYKYKENNNKYIRLLKYIDNEFYHDKVISVAPINEINLNLESDDSVDISIQRPKYDLMITSLPKNLNSWIVYLNHIREMIDFSIQVYKRMLSNLLLINLSNPSGVTMYDVSFNQEHMLTFSRLNKIVNAYDHYLSDQVVLDYPIINTNIYTQHPIEKIINNLGVKIEASRSSAQIGGALSSAIPSAPINKEADKLRTEVRDIDYCLSGETLDNLNEKNTLFSIIKDLKVVTDNSNNNDKLVKEFKEVLKINASTDINVLLNKPEYIANREGEDEGSKRRALVKILRDKQEGLKNIVTTINQDFIQSINVDRINSIIENDKIETDTDYLGQNDNNGFLSVIDDIVGIEDNNHIDSIIKQTIVLFKIVFNTINDEFVDYSYNTDGMSEDILKDFIEKHKIQITNKKEGLVLKNYLVQFLDQVNSLLIDQNKTLFLTIFNEHFVNPMIKWCFIASLDSYILESNYITHRKEIIENILGFLKGKALYHLHNTINRGYDKIDPTKPETFGLNCIILNDLYTSIVQLQPDRRERSLEDTNLLIQFTKFKQYNNNLNDLKVKGNNDKISDEIKSKIEDFGGSESITLYKVEEKLSTGTQLGGANTVNSENKTKKSIDGRAPRSSNLEENKEKGLSVIGLGQFIVGSLLDIIDKNKNMSASNDNFISTEKFGFSGEFTANVVSSYVEVLVKSNPTILLGIEFYKPEDFKIAYKQAGSSVYNNLFYAINEEKLILDIAQSSNRDILDGWKENDPERYKDNALIAKATEFIRKNSDLKQELMNKIKHLQGKLQQKPNFIYESTNYDGIDLSHLRYGYGLYDNKFLKFNDKNHTKLMNEDEQIGIGTILRKLRSVQIFPTNKITVPLLTPMITFTVGTSGTGKTARFNGASYFDEKNREGVLPYVARNYGGVGEIKFTYYTSYGRRVGPKDGNFRPLREVLIFFVRQPESPLNEFTDLSNTYYDKSKDEEIDNSKINLNDVKELPKKLLLFAFTETIKEVDQTAASSGQAEGALMKKLKLKKYKFEHLKKKRDLEGRLVDSGDYPENNVSNFNTNDYYSKNDIKFNTNLNIDEIFDEISKRKYSLLKPDRVIKFINGSLGNNNESDNKFNDFEDSDLMTNEQDVKKYGKYFKGVIDNIYDLEKFQEKKFVDLLDIDEIQMPIKVPIKSAKKAQVSKGSNEEKHYIDYTAGNVLIENTPYFEQGQLAIGTMIATRNNRQSSRAHTFYIINTPTGERIPLIDMAGTETLYQMNDHVLSMTDTTGHLDESLNRRINPPDVEKNIDNWESRQITWESSNSEQTLTLSQAMTYTGIIDDFDVSKMIDTSKINGLNDETAFGNVRKIYDDIKIKGKIDALSEIGDVGKNIILKNLHKIIKVEEIEKVKDRAKELFPNIFGESSSTTYTYINPNDGIIMNDNSNNTQLDSLFNGLLPPTSFVNYHNKINEEGLYINHTIATVLVNTLVVGSLMKSKSKAEDKGGFRDNFLEVTNDLLNKDNGGGLFEQFKEANLCYFYNDEYNVKFVPPCSDTRLIHPLGNMQSSLTFLNILFGFTFNNKENSFFHELGLNKSKVEDYIDFNDGNKSELEKQIFEGSTTRDFNNKSYAAPKNSNSEDKILQKIPDENKIINQESYNPSKKIDNYIFERLLEAKFNSIKFDQEVDFLSTFLLARDFFYNEDLDNEGEGERFYICEGKNNTQSGVIKVKEGCVEFWKGSTDNKENRAGAQKNVGILNPEESYKLMIEIQQIYLNILPKWDGTNENADSLESYKKRTKQNSDWKPINDRYNENSQYSFKDGDGKKAFDINNNEIADTASSDPLYYSHGDIVYKKTKIGNGMYEGLLPKREGSNLSTLSQLTYFWPNENKEYVEYNIHFMQLKEYLSNLYIYKRPVFYKYLSKCLDYKKEINLYKLKSYTDLTELNRFQDGQNLDGSYIEKFYINLNDASAFNMIDSEGMKTTGENLSKRLDKEEIKQDTNILLLKKLFNSQFDITKDYGRTNLTKSGQTVSKADAYAIYLQKQMTAVNNYAKSINFKHPSNFIDEFAPDEKRDENSTNVFGDNGNLNHTNMHYNHKKNEDVTEKIFCNTDKFIEILYKSFKSKVNFLTIDSIPSNNLSSLNIEKILTFFSLLGMEKTKDLMDVKSLKDEFSDKPVNVNKTYLYAYKPTLKKIDQTLLLNGSNESVNAQEYISYLNDNLYDIGNDPKYKIIGNDDFNQKIIDSIYILNDRKFIKQDNRSLIDKMLPDDHHLSKKDEEGSNGIEAFIYLNLIEKDKFKSFLENNGLENLKNESINIQVNQDFFEENVKGKIIAELKSIGNCVTVTTNGNEYNPSQLKTIKDNLIEKNELEQQKTTLSSQIERNRKAISDHENKKERLANEKAKIKQEISKIEQEITSKKNSIPRAPMMGTLTRDQQNEKQIIEQEIRKKEKEKGEKETDLQLKNTEIATNNRKDNRIRNLKTVVLPEKIKNREDIIKELNNKNIELGNMPVNLEKLRKIEFQVNTIKFSDLDLSLKELVFKCMKDQNEDCFNIFGTTNIYDVINNLKKSDLSIEFDKEKVKFSDLYNKEEIEYNEIKKFLQDVKSYDVDYENDDNAIIRKIKNDNKYWEKLLSTLRFTIKIDFKVILEDFLKPYQETFKKYFQIQNDITDTELNNLNTKLGDEKENYYKYTDKILKGASINLERENQDDLNDYNLKINLAILQHNGRVYNEEYFKKALEFIVKNVITKDILINKDKFDKLLIGKLPKNDIAKQILIDIFGLNDDSQTGADNNNQCFKKGFENMDEGFIGYNFFPGYLQYIRGKDKDIIIDMFAKDKDKISEMFVNEEDINNNYFSNILNLILDKNKIQQISDVEYEESESIKKIIKYIFPNFGASSTTDTNKINGGDIGIAMNDLSNNQDFVSCIEKLSVKYSFENKFEEVLKLCKNIPDKLKQIFGDNLLKTDHNGTTLDNLFERDQQSPKIFNLKDNQEFYKFENGQFKVNTSAKLDDNIELGDLLQIYDKSFKKGEQIFGVFKLLTYLAKVNSFIEPITVKEFVAPGFPKFYKNYDIINNDDFFKSFLSRNDYYTSMKFKHLPEDASGNRLFRGEGQKLYPTKNDFKGIYNFQALLDNPVNNIDSIGNKLKIKRFKFLDTLLPKLLFMNTITGKESKMESTSSVASLIDAISILGKLDSEKFYGKLIEGNDGEETYELITKNEDVIKEKINKYEKTCLITNIDDENRFNNKGCENDLGNPNAQAGPQKIISKFNSSEYYPGGFLLPTPDKDQLGGRKKNGKKYTIKYKYLNNSKYANI